MRLDVHAHYFPGEYMSLLEKLGCDPVSLSGGKFFTRPSRDADLAERLGAMDMAKVDKQVLSIAGVVPYSESEQNAVDGARLGNDLYAGVARHMPARFAAFAVLPLPHVKASIAEIARAFDELGMWGVTITTSVLGRSMADPAFDGVYEELNRRGAVVFMHPSGFACGSPQLVKTGLTWPLGAPFEDSMAVLELLQAGFTTRFPKIRMIVPHLGGTLPFLMQRLDHMADRFMPGKGKASERLRDFWYDTVNAYPPSLRQAIETYGLDRLVFGTDWPFWQGEAHQLAADYLTQAGLSASDIAMIDSGNARALFGDKF